MIAAERWRDNWRVVAPSGAVPIEVGRSASRRRAASETVRALPPGTPVVLGVGLPWPRSRSRAFALEAGLDIERAYLAFPSARAPGYLVEDAAAPVAHFLRTVLVAPPGTLVTAPVAAALALLRGLGLWRVVRALAPGRIVIGRRR